MPGPVSTLSPDAMTVLETVASAGELPSAGLSARCSMSNERVGVAVGELVHAGLISVFRGPTGQPLVRLSADASVRGLLRNPAAANAPRPARRLLEARATLEEMHRGEREYPVGVERLMNAQQIYDTLLEIARTTRKEAISVLAGPPPSPDMLVASREQDIELVQRPLAVRILYPMEYAGLPHVARYAQELTEAGAKVRFGDRLPHRLLVFDRRVAVAPVDYNSDDRIPGHGAIVVREEILARSLGHLATTMFRRGRPLDEAVARVDKPSGPSPLDQRVLLLMASGLADAGCAQRLGVTDRTFRRYVGSLLTRLGANSRFDAGVKAVEHGWL